MKDGYSLIAGDFLPADRLEYLDCIDFQIVCPCCSNPLFKAVRSRGSAAPIHYLSHYPAHADEGRECERRVSSGAHGGDRAHAINQARDQRLAYFKAVIPAEIIKITAELIPDWQTEHARLNSSPAYRQVARTMWVVEMREPIVSMEDWLKGSAAYAAWLKSNLCAFPECFQPIAARFATMSVAANDMRQRCAFDIFTTLGTHGMRDTFYFLLRHAFHIWRMKTHCSARANEILSRFLSEDRSVGKVATAELMTLTTDEVSGFPMLYPILNDCRAYINHMLLQIDYVELLKRATFNHAARERYSRILSELQRENARPAAA